MGFRLTLRSIKSGSYIAISDFYGHLPEDISKEDRKAAAQYVVDQFGESEGFQFQFHDSRSISSRARNLPSEFANAVQFRFRCSQRLRTPKPSTLPYCRTRNRRISKKRVECTGFISVFFPSLTSGVFNIAETAHDIAVEFKHSLHPGCEQYGVPLNVRKWIRENPCSTSSAQREELFRAIRKGEIEGVTELTYLGPTLLHYWWRKGLESTVYVSEDPWVNAEHILREHPMVKFEF